MADRGAETRVVLERNAADPSLDLFGIFFVKILYDVKLHIPAAFAGKTVDRINIADRLERLAHQDKAFLFDLDDAPAGMRVRLQRISRDRARGRGRLVEQDRDRDVALFSQTFCVDIFRLHARRPCGR